MTTTSSSSRAGRLAELDPCDPPTLVLPTRSLVVYRPTPSELGCVPDSDTLILVFAADQIEAMTVLKGKEVYLGREHVSNDVQPDIDLTRYNGSSKGVSRLHASLRHDINGWWLIDLGSTNGTWLNKTRLAPKEPRSLTLISEVRLGRLDLQIILSTTTF